MNFTDDYYDGRCHGDEVFVDEDAAIEVGKFNLAQMNAAVRFGRKLRARAMAEYYRGNEHVCSLELVRLFWFRPAGLS